MEKISGILPQSPRTQSTDTRSSLPVRPGTPAFGRPVGTSTVGFRSELSTAERARATLEELSDKRKAEQESAKMVEELNHRFFMKPVPPTSGEQDLALSEDSYLIYDSDTPPGSLIDVSA